MTPKTGTAARPCPPEPDPVSAQVERIVESPAFLKSQRRQDLLRYLVRLTLEGRGDEITERRVAAEVFGRDADFEPSVDSIVRVEIRRLRAALEAYYAEEGRADALAIQLPRGSYEPVFAPSTAGSPPPGHLQVEPTALRAQPPASRAKISTAGRWLFVSCAVAAIVAAVAGGLARRMRMPELTRITEFPGRQGQPTLSPDGTRVAFSWDSDDDFEYQIFVKSVQGDGIRRLTPGPTPAGGPAWSPDGSSIAYLRVMPSLPNEVHLVPADGGPDRVLTTIHTKIAGIAWTPDSLSLVVPDSPPDKPLALFLVSIATGERHQLTDYGSYFHPAVSTDGRTLAFATDKVAGRQGALCLLPLGSGYLPAGGIRVLQETAAPAVFWPTWRVDGTSLLYSMRNQGRWSIWTIPASGGKPQPVDTHGEGTIYGREFAKGRLLLVRQRYRLFLAKVGDENPGQVTAPKSRPEPLFQSVERDYQGAFSPDGSRIAFNSYRGGQLGLWVANADGTGAVRVEIPGGLQPRAAAVWAPDGRNLYFWGEAEAPNTGRSRILRATVATPGTSASPIQAVPLDLDNADNMKPRLSHDGMRLYFTSGSNGTYRIKRAAVHDGAIQSGPVEAVSPQSPGTKMPIAEESVDGEYLFHTSIEGIQRVALKTGKRELFLPVPAVTMRVVADGIYYDTETSIQAGVVYFQPFGSPGPAEAIHIGPYQSWTPIAGRHRLLAGLIRQESGIELYEPR